MKSHRGVSVLLRLMLGSSSQCPVIGLHDHWTGALSTTAFLAGNWYSGLLPQSAKPAFRSQSAFAIGPASDRILWKQRAYTLPEVRLLAPTRGMTKRTKGSQCPSLRVTTFVRLCFGEPII